MQGLLSRPGAWGEEAGVFLFVLAMIAFLAPAAYWHIGKSLMCGHNGWRPDCALTPSDFLNLEFVSLAALLIFPAWRRGRRKTQS